MIATVTKPQAHSTVVPNSTQIRETHLKVIYLGMALSLGVSAVLLLMGYFLRQNVAGAGTGAEPDRIFFYALLAVALSELPVALLMKKLMLKPLPESGAAGAAIPTTGYVFSRYMVIFNLAAACPVYGFVWFFLGGTFPEFVLFAVIGLIIFRLVRPQAEFFYSLFGVRPAIE